MVTKFEIINLLKTRDAAVARALVVLNERQTADEQVQEGTKYLNGRGFRPCHARMGTSMAKFFLRNGYLTPKQINYWRALQKDGKMRIEIYAGQLLEVSSERARKARMMETPAPRVADIGNLMEERMVLLEQMDACQNSEDGEGVEREMDLIAARIQQIDEQVEEYRRCEYMMQRDAALG